ncbi:MAG: type II toxin-antitoxin system RelE/ParE family toxin [Sulfurovum sp.]|nr:type II toxin-antitoxin system RelE/ParE family toxin [Sulfurovum sp.]
MKVEILKKAQKDISKLDVSLIRDILLSIKDLENYPDISNIKKLRNHKPIYRKRIGNYRILFDIEDEVLIVGRVLHRSKAYE